MSLLLDRFHYLFGRTKWLSNVILKLRNQCNCVVKYKLCIEANPNLNGEYLVLKTLAPEIRFFVDVGANIGDYTGYLNSLKELANVHLFEPSDQCFEVLQSRFAGKKNTVLHKMAIGDTVGQTDFYFDVDGSETASVVLSNKTLNTYKVEINTLDNLFKSEQIDFIKIDTEGFDFFVLKGAENMLKQHRLRFIQFEYGDFWRYSGSTLYSVIKYLEKFGYKVFRIDDGGLFEHDYEKYGEYFMYSNFLACHKSELKRLREFSIFNKPQS